MPEKTENASVNDKELMTPVPMEERTSWVTPMLINAGCEFSTAVIMVGAALVAGMGFRGMLLPILVAFCVLTWCANSISGYIGAKTGLSSSVIARCDFGDRQAKFIVALVIGVISMGWWAIQTSVTANAVCVIFNIDYVANKGVWAVVVVITGIIFCIPSVLGYSSMKWTDYLAVPGGLALCIVGVYLALKNVGWQNIVAFQGNGSLSFATAVTTVLGMNVSQFVISADYTCRAKPKVKDNVLIPLGIILTGIPLLFVGAMMSAGTGSMDIVAVMQSIGFGTWGFIVLWLAAWTSQLVNNYTMGLSFANILNVHSESGRKKITLISTFLCIALSIWGILDHYTDLLSMASLIYPAIAGVMFVGFFARGQKWQDKSGWNWVATFAMICGIAVGYLTNYVVPMGIPPLQSIVVTGLVYYVAMKIKAKAAPDVFTEGFGT